MLFRQGNHGTSLYLLVEGMVDVSVTLPRAGERANPGSTVATLEAKTVLGELGLLLGASSTASIIARSDRVCSQITRGSFYAVIDLGDVLLTLVP